MQIENDSKDAGSEMIHALEIAQSIPEIKSFSRRQM